jgi:hypothetical protein
MRALGQRGGKARRKGLAGQLPEAERQSLREHLRRGLDPELVVRAANEILAGENQAARGNMIRFLADLELYRHGGGECPRCKAHANIDMAAVRAKLTTLLVRQSAAATEADERRIEARAEQLAEERLAALRQEHAIG